MCATYKEVIIEFSAARVVVANKHLFIESNDRGKKKCKVFGTFQKRWSHWRRQDKSKHKFTPKNAARRCHEASLASIRYINQNAINKSISSR